MRRHTRFSSRSGMTMLEMMVALTILLSMTVAVALTLSASIEFNTLLSKRDATTRSARATLQKLRRELQLAYLTPARNNPETIRTVFVGMDDEPDKLYFSTLAHQRMYMNSRESDQAEITIWAESSPSEVGEGYILYHRESERVDEEPGQGGRVHPLAYNVRSFNVRYLNPADNEWVDEWDSRGSETPYRLPRAVEIGLVLIAEDPDDADRTIDVPFLSRFILEFGQRLRREAPGLADVAAGVGNAGAVPPAGGAAPLLPGGGLRGPGLNSNPLPSFGGGAPWQMTQGNAGAIQNRRNARGNNRRRPNPAAVRSAPTPVRK